MYIDIPRCCFQQSGVNGSRWWSMDPRRLMSPACSTPEEWTADRISNRVSFNAA